MKVDPTVAALVLFAALLHASWNAIVKSDRDRLMSFGLVMMAGSLIAVPVLPVVAMPGATAWPYLIASVVVHNFYYFFLLRAYAHGDLSHVYPIARGLGPLLVAVLSGRLAGEYLSFAESAGVTLLSIGIASLAFGHGLPRNSAEWKPVLYALGTGVCIAGYTLVDGLGVRASGDAIGYIAWLNLLEGPWVLGAALWWRGRERVVPYLRAYWWRGTAGGIIATLGYGIAIWAMSVGALAHVAALRETSVLFAAVMGTALLGEGFGRRRIAAAVLVVAGLLLMNLPLFRGSV
jgi:drug/metabolite transporter (DMT)-like permease